jgi:uncharacterized membrane protein YfhO
MKSKNIKSHILRLLGYLISPIAVMAIFLTIFALKDIYPFGNGVVDAMDMAQANIPVYYHVWDWLHGSKDLFLDWYTGLSVNMAGSVAMASLLSPFNLFFLFIPRENLHLSMGLFTMIKLMAAAGAMFFCLKKSFKVNAFWLNIFSIAYAFSGYAIMYYSNSQWLDIMAIFPLLMHSLIGLFKNRRTIPYIIILSLCFIINIYISIMVLLFVFFISGIYVIFISKAQRKRLINLGAGTLMAAAFSAFLVIPAYLQIDASARSSWGGGTLWAQYLAMMNAPDAIDLGRWFLLFPCALPLAITAAGIVKSIKKSNSDKRIAGFWLCGILIVGLPFFFETVSLIWHGGSYMMFPVRFSFIFTFMVIASACYYVSVSPWLNSHKARAHPPKLEDGQADASDEEALKIPCEAPRELPYDELFEEAPIVLYEELFKKMRKNSYSELFGEAKASVLYEEIFEETPIILYSGLFKEAPIVSYEGLFRQALQESPEILCGGESNCYAQPNKNKTVAGIGLLIFEFIVTLVLTSAVIYTAISGAFVFQSDNPNIFSPTLLMPAVLISIILFTAYMLLTNKRNTKINHRLVAVLLILEVFSFSYVYIGYNAPAFSAYISTANDLRRELDLKADDTARIKTMGHSLNTNYPFILERSSISNWTHTISGERQSAAATFGYTLAYTRMLDVGGTVFSDALFNVKNTLSVHPLDPRLYDETGFGAKHYYYDNRYTLPFGIPVNSQSLENLDSSNPFFYTDGVYKNMFSKNDKLVHVIKYEHDTDPNFVSDFVIQDNVVSMDVTVSGRKALYFASIGDSRIHVFNINGSPLIISGDVNNNATFFPSIFDSNVLCLGVFENETVNIIASYVEDSTIGSGCIAQLDLDIMEALTEEWADFDTNAVINKRSISLSVDSADPNHNMLFLPISYDEGWNCIVNGQKVEARKILGSFIGVPITPGRNEIVMNFTPKGMGVGVVISTGALLLLVGGLFALKKYKASEHYSRNNKRLSLEYKVLREGVYVFYMILWLGFVTVIYFVPIAYSLISKLFPAT